MAGEQELCTDSLSRDKLFIGLVWHVIITHKDKDNNIQPTQHGEEREKERDRWVRMDFKNRISTLEVAM